MSNIFTISRLPKKAIGITSMNITGTNHQVPELNLNTIWQLTQTNMLQA